MRHRAVPEFIALQLVLPLLDSKISWANHHPPSSFLQTDAAIACHCFFQFQKLDAELKSSAMAIAIIDFEFWRWFCHFERMER